MLPTLYDNHCFQDQIGNEGIAFKRSPLQWRKIEARGGMRSVASELAA